MSLRLAERDGPSETVPSALHERIAARAYGLYIARGAADGNDQEDWLRAEAEILAGEGGPADDASAPARRGRTAAGMGVDVA